MSADIRRALMIARKISKAEGGETPHPLTQDVYHGTQAQFSSFQEGLNRRGEYQPSLMLGTHVARDPVIANNGYFTQRAPDKGGHVLPLKTYPDEKFFEIPQKKPNGEMDFDDDAVEKAVKLHAFKKNPDMLAFALMQSHGAQLEDAMQGANKLIAGKSWKSPLNGATYKDVHELVHNPHYSPYFPSPEARKQAVKSFRDHLIKQGYAGVKYENTAPEETAGAKDKTCYIVFTKPTSEGYYPLRGRFAAMNPADKADPDLMKSEGGAIDAYHGSPHDFDKFDFSKIGTGEGAQVYGHGIYIAENPAVADSYKQAANAWATDEANGVSNAQSNYNYFRKAHKTIDKEKGRWVSRPAQSHEQAIKSVYDDLTETPEKAHIHRHTLNALDVFAKTGKWPMVRQGRLYDVRFHTNPEHLIDLDKPTLGEQTPRVQRGVKDAIDMMPESVKEMSSFAPMRDKNTRPDAPIFSAMKFADEPRLATAGVPGNKYFDQYSRGAKNGTRNYVVFPTDKEVLEILRKRADGGKVARRAVMIAKAGGGGKYIGPLNYAVGGRADENDDVWWHGSGSGDLRGGESGLHLGTRGAAEDALNARIGFPAEGSWDGTREYGKTKLAGKNTILKRNKDGVSGHNVYAPDEDYFPHEHPKGLPEVSRDVTMNPSWKPNIAGYRIKGPMSNTTRSPHADFKANGYMKAALKKGNAKRGYFYRNEGEDSGSISAVVPDDRHIEPIKRAEGGKVYKPFPRSKDPKAWVNDNYARYTEDVPVEWLEKMPGNDRRLKLKDYADLKRKLIEEGIREPLMIQWGTHSRKAMLGEGNHRLMIAKELGYTHVPARVYQGTNVGKYDYDHDLIPAPGEYAPSDAKPSDVFKSLKRATGGRTGHNGGPPLDATIPPFKLYSGAAKIIREKGQAKGTPQQFATLPGIKPDDLKHGRFTDLPAKAQSKEDVARHLEENMVPLTEKTLGKPDLKALAREEFDNNRSYFREIFNDQHGREYRSDKELLTYIEELMAERHHDGTLEGGNGTKFKQYSLPGGENYREVLLHLPPKPPKEHPELAAAEARYKELERAHDDILADQITENPRHTSDDYARAATALHEAAQRRIHLRAVSKRDENKDNFYAEHHWDEPNVLAHIRMSDRKGPNGEKVLHVEEVQSDWGQQGRKHGFRDEAAHAAANAAHAKAHQEYRDYVNKHYPDRTLENEHERLRDSEVWRLNNNIAIANAMSDDVKRALPAGPYVDNTQKWTDLALKRVLHEAAHGGYDKVVFTPGDEQNKRYPDGESDHRKYYDEIMPKRLQTLAKQHDPQAQVQLHAHPITAPNDTERYLSQFTRIAGEEMDPTGSTNLHSLDVTPQMRESIKTNGFSQFKRGGAVDENEGPIADWHWRPLGDVRDELQLHEIPSHVHKFGEFMDETARRAASQGLTPRDLIKAYAITRASIGRRALPVETLRQTFPELPGDVTGRVRPEGAMGHWLHTKMGQRYLDAAEAGRVDDEAIAHAQNAMRRFGKVETEPKALRWAAQNLPGREGRVSELIARAHRGQSSPGEWRSEMRVPGVAASKAGFLASMLGRGDQPTLDARQIILHTGRPTKEAAPILGRKGAADAAVDRLAARQTELGFKHDKSMSPFYQHLAHHAIWDKTAGEETTHDDLMQALRGAKDGGRQGYATRGKVAAEPHPLVRALVEGFPHGFKDVPEYEVQRMLRNPFTDPRPATHNLLARAAGITGHSEDELLKAMLQSGPREPQKQGITSQRRPDIIERAMATIAPNKRIAVAPAERLTPEDLFRRNAVIVGGMSDRSGAGYDVTGADKTEFEKPVSALGGVDYNRMPHSIKNRLGWASARQAISGLANAGREHAEKVGADQVLLTPKLMGLQSLDQSHMIMKAATDLLRHAPVTKQDEEAFNNYVRSLRPSAKKGEIQPPHMPDFPGIKHPDLFKYLMKQNMPDRAQLIKAMDVGAWNKKGIPNPASLRMAFTKPELLRAPMGTPGAMFTTIDTDRPHHEDVAHKHPSYEIGLRGENVGSFDRVMPKELMFSDYFNDPANAGRRPVDLMNAYMKKPVVQHANQQWLDRIMPEWERTQPGWKQGGSVVDRALAIVGKKTNGR